MLEMEKVLSQFEKPCSERQETKDNEKIFLESEMINFDSQQPREPHSESRSERQRGEKHECESVATPLHRGETCPPVADVGRMGLLGLVPHIDWLEMCLRLYRLIKEEQKQR